MRSATRAHRVAADVRWLLVAQLVLVYAIVVCADVGDSTTTTITTVTFSEATAAPIPAEATTPSINTTAENVTSTIMPSEKFSQSQTTFSSQVSEKTTTSDESQTEIVRSEPVVQSVSQVPVPETSTTSEDTTTKEPEDSASASELGLESVQLAVVIKSPLTTNGTVKAFVKNVADGHIDEDQDDDGSGYEYDADDDSDDHGHEYDGEDDDSGEGSLLPPKPSSTMQHSSDQGLELSREATTEASSSTTSAPRRPRHSDAGELQIPKEASPRQRRPSRAKDERRVSLRYAESGTLKKRRTPKERTARPTSTAPPLPPPPETRLTYYQVGATERPDTSDQVITTRRPKRRKKKARRQKQAKPTSPPERQLTAETRAAAESAAESAAVNAVSESLQTELTVSATAPAKTPETDPTAPISRAVRQDDVSIQQSEVNPDGSYSFSYDIADEGRHSRTEIGSPDNVVSGRYGYIDGNNRATHTQYSAGPRGFRAVGPDIARRMDLSQAGPAPRPPPDGRYSPEYDTYSDPNEDPSYSFQYSTDTANRREEANSRGDVFGKYEFIDDQGERHVVSYEAGADKGFLVKSSHPDNAVPAGFFPGRGEVPPRGRASILRSRNGAYRFTAVGPDSRREECSNAANYRRGSYVYLDDKNVRRTVYYEAGPNIGFRVLSSPAAANYRCPPWQGYLGENSGGFGADSPTPGTTPGSWSVRPVKPSIGGSTKRPWSVSSNPPNKSTPRPWEGGLNTPSGGGDDPLSWFSPDPYDPDRTDFVTSVPPISSPRPHYPSPTKPPHRLPTRPTNRPPSKPTPSPFEPQPTTYKPSGGSGSTTSAPTDFLGTPDAILPIPPFPLPAKRPLKPSGPSGTSGGANRYNTAFDKIFPKGPPSSTERPPNIVQQNEHEVPQYRPVPSIPDSDGYRPPYSCCGRLHVLSASDERYGRAHPIRTYIQSIDLSEEERGAPGRAENPSAALERHVREQERTTSRRQRRRRRRRRRSVF